MGGRGSATSRAAVSTTSTLDAAPSRKISRRRVGGGGGGSGRGSGSSSSLDWSFLDAAYLITCPNADPNSTRLRSTLSILESIGLGGAGEIGEVVGTDAENLPVTVQVKAFDTDDDDRVRGCYDSHLSVMRDALTDLDASKEGGKRGGVKGLGGE